MSLSRRVYVDFKSEAFDDICPDLFEVVGFEGTEAISQPFRFDLSLVSDEPDIDLSSLIGKKACIQISRDGRNREVHGVISELQQDEETKTHKYSYKATLVPRIWLMSLSRQNQIYQEKTVPQIVSQEILGGDAAGGMVGDELELRLDDNYPKKEYTVQYRETDLNFISRLLEHEGIYYYFDHSQGCERLVLCDNNSKLDPVSEDNTVCYVPPSGLASFDEQAIHRFSHKQKQISQKVILKDYNYRTPHIPLLGEAETFSVAETDEHGLGYGEQNLYGDHFKDTTQAANLANIRAQALRCKQQVCFGHSDALLFEAGKLFQMEDHYRKDFNQQYLVTTIHHKGGQALPGISGSSASGDGIAYENNFEVIATSIEYRPALNIKKPKLYGFMSAIVDGAADTDRAQIDEHGRYKLTMPFDVSGTADGKASRWVRKAESYGGQGTGMHFPLLKGTEVIWSCMDGDLDRPIITGVVPGGETNKSVVSSQNSTVNKIKTPGNIVIEMQDGKGTSAGQGSEKPMTRMVSAAQGSAITTASSSTTTSHAMAHAAQPERTLIKAATMPTSELLTQQQMATDKNARKRAKDAQATADQASADAAAAQSTADQASADATAAQSTADQASADAAAAQATADGAGATAQNNEQATQNNAAAAAEADRKALAAQATADQASADAAAAQATADGAAAAAQNNEQATQNNAAAAAEADRKALAAQATADQASADAAAAQATADGAAAAAQNNEQATQNNAAAAAEADRKALAAQATADQASLDAAAAQNTADQAVIDAKAADDKATAAQTEAEKTSMLGDGKSFINENESGAKKWLALSVEGYDGIANNSFLRLGAMSINDLEKAVDEDDREDGITLYTSGNYVLKSSEATLTLSDGITFTASANMKGSATLGFDSSVSLALASKVAVGGSLSATAGIDVSAFIGGKFSYAYSFDHSVTGGHKYSEVGGISTTQAKGVLLLATDLEDESLKKEIAPFQLKRKVAAGVFITGAVASAATYAGAISTSAASNKDTATDIMYANLALTVGTMAAAVTEGSYAKKITDKARQDVDQSGVIAMDKDSITLSCDGSSIVICGQGVFINGVSLVVGGMPDGHNAAALAANKAAIEARKKVGSVGSLGYAARDTTAIKAETAAAKLIKPLTEPAKNNMEKFEPGVGKFGNLRVDKIEPTFVQINSKDSIDIRSKKQLNVSVKEDLEFKYMPIVAANVGTHLKMEIGKPIKLEDKKQGIILDATGQPFNVNADTVNILAVSTAKYFGKPALLGKDIADVDGAAGYKANS